MDFSANTIDLSLINAQTGRMLTANVYDVTFDDGTKRTMSVGQLVMAICLERATEMEAEVVDIMNTMAGTTNNIDTLADIETKILEASANKDEISLSSIEGNWVVTRTDPDTGEIISEMAQFASQALSLMGVSYTSSATSTIEYIESKMDELNTNSQEQMITLQSQTNKRDQAYEMISNVLKSIYTVLSGVVNNY